MEVLGSRGGSTTVTRLLSASADRSLFSIYHTPHIAHYVKTSSAVYKVSQTLTYSAALKCIQTVKDMILSHTIHRERSINLCLFVGVIETQHHLLVGGSDQHSSVEHAQLVSEALSVYTTTAHHLYTEIIPTSYTISLKQIFHNYCL